MWKMSDRRTILWWMIALSSIGLIVFRTVRFGWFQGKDVLLWAVLVYALYRAFTGAR